MIPFPLIAAVVAVGGAIWYLKRRGSAPAVSGGSSSSSLTPGSVPDSGVPTYAFTMSKIFIGDHLYAHLVEAPLNKFPQILVSQDPKSPQNTWIITSKLPIDVLISVPADFSPPAEVEATAGNEVLSPAGSRDVLIRINEYSGNSYVNASSNPPHSAVVTANFKHAGQNYQDPQWIYVVSGP